MMLFLLKLVGAIRNMTFLLKLVGAILAFCSVSVIVFFVLCLIPDGDSHDKKH